MCYLIKLTLILHPKQLKTNNVSELEDYVYDDQEAVKFIQNNLPQEYKRMFSEDEITYMTDVIYDYFESQGMLDPDLEDEETDVDMDDITEYVMKNAKRDGFKFDEIAVRWVIEGEFDYEESLG